MESPASNWAVHLFRFLRHLKAYRSMPVEEKEEEDDDD